MLIEVERPGRQSKWLRIRHRSYHANRPIHWNVEIEGCPECLLEIIWHREPLIVQDICRQHDTNHPNLLSGDLPVRGSRFKGCSRCIDSIFTAWAELAKKKPIQFKGGRMSTAKKKTLPKKSVRRQRAPSPHAIQLSVRKTMARIGPGIMKDYEASKSAGCNQRVR